MVRLPTVGGDQDGWGDLLNEYLLVSHTDDGRMSPLVVSYPYTATKIATVGALTGNISIANPTGTPVDGQVLTFRFSQDSVGSRTVTWDTEYAFDTSTTVPNIPAVANTVWEMSFRWNATTSLWQMSENSASGASINMSSSGAITLVEWTLAEAYALTSITRDVNEAITTASVVWPDSSTGVFTTDTASTAFPGAIDAYHVTYIPGSGTTKTITQPLLTRDSSGAVTAQPVLTIA
jgi:hypothetical protein